MSLARRLSLSIQMKNRGSAEETALEETDLA